MPYPYEICIQGEIHPSWSEWFEGLEISRGPGHTTILCGELPDQAGLHGVLAKIRDLGVELIWLRQVGKDRTFWE